MSSSHCTCSWHPLLSPCSCTEGGGTVSFVVGMWRTSSECKLVSWHRTSNLQPIRQLLSSHSPSICKYHRCLYAYTPRWMLSQHTGCNLSVHCRHGTHSLQVSQAGGVSIPQVDGGDKVSGNIMNGWLPIYLRWMGSQPAQW